MFRRIFSLVVVSVFFAAPAFAAPSARAVDARPAASDQLIADRIGEQINRYVYYTIFDDVQGRVDNGLVTLTGKVTATPQGEGNRGAREAGGRRARGRQQDRDAAGINFRRSAAGRYRDQHLSRWDVLELRDAGEPAHPRDRRSRARHAHRRGELGSRTACCRDEGTRDLRIVQRRQQASCLIARWGTKLTRNEKLGTGR